jgi:phosphoribosylglycinamide formyltransferase 1
MRIAIFASGSGSNAENIYNYFAQTGEHCIELIVTNKADAYVLERAKKLGIPSVMLSKETLYTKGSLLKLMMEYRIDFIVLAGYLLRIPEDLIEAYPQRIINIHPALLPKFGGKGMYGDFVHKGVIEAGEQESGITIHLVNEQYDEGQVIFQTTCPVLKSDTPQTLASRIHALEYEYFPKVINDWITKQRV